MTAPWLLYSRYGTWRMSEGGDRHNLVERLDEASLQRIRAVMINQRVAQVELDEATNALALTFSNAVGLTLSPELDASSDEDAWNLKIPGGLLVEAWSDRLSLRREASQTLVDNGNAAAIHDVLRRAADEVGLTLHEPPMTDKAHFDAIFHAPDGTALLMQIKATGAARGFGLRNIVVRPDATSPKITNTSVAELTADLMAHHVRRLLAAA